MVGFSFMLRLLTTRPPRWRFGRRMPWRKPPPLWWLRAFGCDRESAALHDRRQLLAGCGIRWRPETYLAARRTALLLLPLALCLAWPAAKGGLLNPLGDGYALLALPIAFCVALYDRLLLDTFRRYRAERIRREIVIVSSQMLYYVGSRLHLHGKLQRCLPYTRLMKGELLLLLNEWYYDPEAALSRFRDRLGTDEAYGFTETIRSLRLNESDEVYDLLREVARENKAKLEMAKAGRKETVSYVLFVLAGVPILYTFQVFLYPWVQESRKLFDLLNS